MRTITKIRRSIRAISPVISVLLMIAIAVAASLVAYAWIMGYIGGTTSKVGKAVMIQSMATNSANPNYLRVYVQNVGQGTVEFDAASCVYINDVRGTLTAFGININPLPEGQTATIEVDLTALGVSADMVKVKVVTKDGTFTETKDSISVSGLPGAYTITVTDTLNGDIDPNTGPYAASSTPSFTITPNSGYRIASITANGAPVTVTTPAGQTYQFAPLAADGSLTATYELIPPTMYTIAVTDTLNGDIAPNSGSYAAGSTPSFTITPNGGYHIATITANGAPVTVTTPAGQSYQFAPVSADGTLTATYAIGTVLLSDGFEATGGAWADNWNQNGATDWIQSSLQVHSGSYSARSDSSNEGDLESDTFSTSGATSVTVSFWMYHTDIGSTDLILRLRSSSSGGSWVDTSLGNTGTDNVWTYYTITTTASQYMHANFRIEFRTNNLGTGDLVYIDDVMIMKIP